MIPFCRPSVTALEQRYMSQAAAGTVCGDGSFTKMAVRLLAEKAGLRNVLLTTSCTHALELAALLAGIGKGDEVILPSFTFSSTANAFLLRGATLRFCDVDPRTMNADPAHMEALVTGHTKILAPIDYAGVSCDIDAVNAIAEKHGLLVIQDSAQSVGSSYKGRPAGADADFACYSFHETKNYVMGEGGAIAFRDPDMEKHAEIIREKGTDRSRFYRGEVDKYTWQRTGSSYLPSDILAAMLSGQLERFDEIMDARMRVWNQYHAAFAGLEEQGLLRRPFIPGYAGHNAHIYYLILNTPEQRDGLLGYLRKKEIGAVFHYIPLHTSPAGRAAGFRAGDLPNTEVYAARLLRLPLFPGLTGTEAAHITRAVAAYFEGC